MRNAFAPCLTLCVAAMSLSSLAAHAATLAPEAAQQQAQASYRE